MTFSEMLNSTFTTLKDSISKEFFIAIIAAWMGARATRKATTRAHEYATKKSKDEGEKLTKNTLLLLGVEITTAWEIYKEEYSEELFELPPNEPYLCTFRIGDNPFPIYDSVPACLTNIEPETSAKLVRLYMRIKGLVRMIELNNDDYERICKAGHDAVQRLIEKANEEKLLINEEGAEKLSEFHSKYIYQESKKIGMGNTADAMKLLTHELENLMTSIKLDIERITK